MAVRDPHLHVIVLAGGIGARFWPASTPSVPKQLLPLGGDRPLIRETVDRALRLVPPDRLAILTGSHLRGPIARTLPPETGKSFLVEPRPRGTGPALAWAAWTLARQDPEAILLSLHSDHVVSPEEEFLDSLRAACHIARTEDSLVTLAVPPTRPETGYGYIRPGAVLEPGSPWDRFRAFRVRSFVEKPDVERARRYLRDGFLWNSGIFAWTARRFLEEVRIHAPEVATHLPLLEAGDTDGFFRTVPPISVDEAVLERSGRVASVEATFQWDDVGTWEALRRTRTADGDGNVALGASYPVAAQNNTVFAPDETVVLFGVEGLLVVRSGGITLVASRERAGELKELLKALPEALRNPDGGHPHRNPEE